MGRVLERLFSKDEFSFQELPPCFHISLFTKILTWVHFPDLPGIGVGKNAALFVTVTGKDSLLDQTLVGLL